MIIGLGLQKYLICNDFYFKLLDENAGRLFVGQMTYNCVRIAPVQVTRVQRNQSALFVCIATTNLIFAFSN